MAELARVLDRDALDRSSGARGRLAIEVPPEWIAEGADVEVLVPTRLACAACDGGGCDGCARSGAFRVELDEARRTVRLSLPAAASSGALVRLSRPFGAEGGLEQLLVAIRSGPSASRGCQRVPTPTALAAPAPAAAQPGVVAFVLVALVLLAAAWLTMR